MILCKGDDDRSYKQGFHPVGMGGYWGLLPGLVDAVATLTNAESQEIDWATASVFQITLGANTTFTFKNVTVGQHIRLVLTQDGTGSRTGTFPAGCVFVGGSKTLTTTAAGIDTVDIHCVAPGVYYCNLLKAYA